MKWFPFRFRFSLKTLFVVVILVAILAVWGKSEFNRRVRRGQIVERMGQYGNLFFGQPTGILVEDIWTCDNEVIRGPTWLNERYGPGFCNNPTYFCMFGSEDEAQLTADLKTFSELATLESFETRAGRLSEEMLEHITSIRGLEDLDIRAHVSISVEGFAKLENARDLESLAVYCDSLCREHLGVMPTLAKLEYFVLSSDNLIDDDLALLRGKLPKLKVLEVIMSQEHLGKNFDVFGSQGTLESFKLKNFGDVRTTLDIELFEMLAKQKKLEYVEFFETALPAGAITMLGNCESLRKLALRYGCEANGIEELATASFQSLEDLSLYYCHLDDSAVDYLIRLQNLKHLNISGNAAITPQGIARLKQALPNCEIAH